MAPEGPRATWLCYHLLSGCNPSLPSRLVTGAKTQRAETAVNNPHFHAGSYIRPMEKKEKKEKKSKMNFNARLPRKSMIRSLTLRFRAEVDCHVALLLLLVIFLLPAFTPMRSMTKGDGNHHNNMQQHNSLVYMCGSHQDSCLHFNRAALVFATLW